MKTLNLVKLERKYFDSDKQYEKYERGYNANNKDASEDDELGNGYVTAIWNLINLFIQEKSSSNDIVKKSPDYQNFSGFQVEFAQNYYQQLKKEV
jgi:hypothetical protein